jgi:hypothetical protein
VGRLSANNGLLHVGDDVGSGQQQEVGSHVWGRSKCLGAGRSPLILKVMQDRS